MENNHELPDLNAKALAVFEERNKAFRVLYDTIIELSKLDDSVKIYETICNNLRIITGAVFAVIASFNGDNNTIVLKAVSSEKEIEGALSLNEFNHSVVLDDEQAEIYKNLTVYKCTRGNCFDELFVDKSFSEFGYDSKNKSYNISFGQKGAKCAIGMIQFKPEDKLKMKDMLDTYLNMATIIIRRLEANIELAKSKQRFFQLLNSSPVGMMLVDSNKKIVEINIYALNLIKRKREDVIGKFCDSIMRCAENKICPISDNDSYVGKTECFVDDVFGVRIPVIKSTEVLYIDEKKYCIEAFVDIRDRKKEEEEKLKLEKQLHQAQKLESIGILAAGIAHEINTPIQFVGNNIGFISKAMDKLFIAFDEVKSFCASQTVGGDVDILKWENDLEKRSKINFFKEEVPLAIAQSKEGLERVRNIVNAMKDFSHVGDESKQEEDINKAINSSIVVSQSEWKRVADLSTDLDASLPPVKCFIGDIKQVVLNLIVNAAHAIKDAVINSNEKGVITVRTYSEEKSVFITVGDTGTGIAEEIREKVFDYFFTTKEVGTGTGQGLAMAYQTIVEKHGGKMFFETEVGKGTVFFIELPIG